MFRKMRNRMLRANLCIISVILLGAFAMIYLLMWHNTNESNRIRMDNIGLTSVTSYVVQAGDENAPVVQARVEGESRTMVGEEGVVTVTISDSAGFMDLYASFILVLDDAYQVLETASHIDLQQESYDAAAEQVRVQDAAEGVITLDGRMWQYMVRGSANISLVTEASEDGSMGTAEVEQTVSGREVVFLDVTESLQSLRQLLVAFAVVVVVMLGVVFLVSRRVADRSIRPLEEAYQKQSQFMADASHEIKTPLAIISANADALLSEQPVTEEAARRWVEVTKEEVGRLGYLVNDMLCMLRQQTVPRCDTMFAFDELVENVIAAMEAVLFEHGIPLRQHITPEVYVKGDPDQLRQVVQILLDNSIKYCAAGGTVQVRLEKRRQWAVLEVSNSCCDTLPEDLALLFDRFYRGDASRASAGFGLGLPIARSIVEGMGGSLTSNRRADMICFSAHLKCIQ